MENRSIFLTWNYSWTWLNEKKKEKGDKERKKKTDEGLSARVEVSLNTEHVTLHMSHCVCHWALTWSGNAF